MVVNLANRLAYAAILSSIRNGLGAAELFDPGRVFETAIRAAVSALIALANRCGEMGPGDG
jgi:hypothetical protein